MFQVAQAIVMRAMAILLIGLARVGQQQRQLHGRRPLLGAIVDRQRQRRMPLRRHLHQQRRAGGPQDRQQGDPCERPGEQATRARAGLDHGPRL
ncbi:Uncharacterised protein [Bordetella pertussis]|nr:hypothetical protein L565_0679 [Bordetella pertussis CHLA-20]CFP67126.1 Uncharacterised protein [Bordetella pertussis]